MSAVCSIFGITLEVEGVMVQWCNPLTLRPEQSDSVGFMPSRTPPLEHHDIVWRTQLGLLYFSDRLALKVHLHLLALNSFRNLEFFSKLQHIYIFYTFENEISSNFQNHIPEERTACALYHIIGIYDFFEHYFLSIREGSLFLVREGVEDILGQHQNFAY